MSTDNEMKLTNECKSNCRSCNEPVEKKYCSNCGYPVIIQKINFKYILSEIGEFFFANKGLLYTVKRVLISPGHSVRMFINEDRYRFVKPITFLFITTLIYALILHIFGVKSTVIQYNIDATVLNTVMIDWLISNPRYTITLTILLIAFWVRVLFRKAGYNYFEIAILLCFITGITTLLDTIAVIINSLMNTTGYDIISAVNGIGFIYMTWGIVQFFGQKMIKNYLKALLAIIISVLCIAILVVVIVLVSNPFLFQTTPSVEISL
jgi:hypothetical protein